ncbi:MAG: hypothetical protein Q8L89_04820 [Gammaproteobacteria bacterium]|nr:hypothetical protein [Gammaproteobacteria bacterium]
MNESILVDGWTIYLWLVVGAMILVAVAFGIRWAMRNEQFDEDIKYVMFNESDRERMDPAEYAKSQEVLASQIKRREDLQKERSGQV